LADVLGKDLRFRTAIAHSIREQVRAYEKPLFLVSHPSDETAVHLSMTHTRAFGKVYTGMDRDNPVLSSITLIQTSTTA
jgi:hypothetical protein